MKKIVILTLELYPQVFFTLDKYLFKIWVENIVFALGGGGGGRCQNAQKQFIIKMLFGTYF